MVRNVNRQRKIGVLLSYIVMISNFVVGLSYTPFLIKMLGQSEYGNYNYVSSLVSYLSLLTCGFGSAYLRFASPYKQNGDKEGVANINGLFLSLFLLMGTISLLIGGFMTWKSDIVLGGNLTDQELVTGKYLMGIMVINIFMVFPVSIFESYIIAHERFIFQKFVALAKAILTPTIILIVLFNGQKSIGVAIATLMVTICIDLVTVLFCFTKLKIRFKFEKKYRKYAKDIFVFSSFLLLSMVVDQINWSVDKFILGKIKGTIVVAIYTVGATINTYYKTMGEAISNVFIPKVYEIIGKKDGDYQATLLMARLGRIQFMILFLILSGFYFFGKTFICLWVGKEYELSYYVILILMIPVTIPEIQKIGLEIQKAKNMHKFRSVTYALIALFNLVITIPLSREWGAIGAALGTAVTVFIGNGLIMNWYYHKKVKINIIYFWNQIIKLAPSVILAILVGYIIKTIIRSTNWLGLLLSASLYSLFYIFILFVFGLNKEEKHLIKRNSSS